MAKSQPLNKQLALVKSHINLLTKIADVDYSLIYDKLFATLNMRFYEQWKSIGGKELNFSNDGEFTQFFDGVYFERQSFNCQKNYVMTEESCDDVLSEFVEENGVDLNDIIQNSTKEFEFIKFDSIFYYDGALDGFEDPDTGEQYDLDEHDLEEIVELLISGALNSSKMMKESSPALGTTTEFSTFIDNLVTYGGQEGADNFLFIILPKYYKLKNHLSKKESTDLSKCLYVLNYFDKNPNFSCYSWDLDGDLVLALWNGYNSYECSLPTTVKPQFYFCLLWIELLYEKYKEVI